MNRDEMRFTIKEISVATGIKAATLSSRKKRLGLEPSGGGYTLAEVKQIVKRPPIPRAFNQKKADALRQMLKNDGAL